MNIKQIPAGTLKANCYILEKENQTIIIDPSGEPEKIKKNIKNKLVKILITHYHQDHIEALNSFDKNLILKNPKEKTYIIGPFTFDVIYTKGHTNDSVTYYFKNENAMFTGDFLFKGTIGRTDLGGNDKDMKQSLDKIKKFKDDIDVYPGHGPKTTLKYEKENNFFLK